MRLLPLILATALSCYVMGMAQAKNPTIPYAQHIAKDCEESTVLLFFTMKSCPYCESVRKLFVTPFMRDNNNPTKTIVVREVDINSRDTLMDEHGQSTTHQQWARHNKVRIVPVLQLAKKTLNRADGLWSCQLVEPAIVGYAEHFYNGYFQTLINRAYQD